VAAVITDIDIWRAARLLIEQHNDGRKIEAAGLADVMLGGDIAGFSRLVGRPLPTPGLRGSGWGTAVSTH
jgi:hypothetical protein